MSNDLEGYPLRKRKEKNTRIYVQYDVYKQDMDYWIRRANPMRNTRVIVMRGDKVVMGLGGTLDYEEPKKDARLRYRGSGM